MAGKAIIPEGKKWEVQSSEGKVTEFFSFAEVKKAILAGEIQPSDKARLVDSTGGKESSTPNWKPVSDTLASSHFCMRVLFEPVWAHTVRGAGIAARIGVILGLANCVLVFLDVEAYGMVFWLSLIGILWAYPVVGPLLGVQQEGIGPLLGIAGLAAYKLNKIVPIWKSLPIALQVQLGATVAGALMGVFPGMIVGTIVGLFRSRRLPMSPSVSRETGVFVKGILIPIILFIALLVLRACFAGWLEEWLKKSPV